MFLQEHKADPRLFVLDELRAWHSDQLVFDLAQVFDEVNLPNPVNEACLYAMNNGGKRVRPLLVLATLMTLQPSANLGMVKRAMIAIEMIHGYSLIHDDLPCMDDDELRRGQPTCHVVYGEAMALLAGDALQSLAFETLTNKRLPWDFDDLIAGHLIAILAPRARRMVAGQVLDLEGENKTLNQAQLEAIHRDKTGALIEAAVLMGGVCAKADPGVLQQLEEYARAIGLAFQVQDDVLDVISDTQTLGKPVGSDQKLEKSTYVKLLGVEEASRYACQLFDEARFYVASFGKDNLLLQLVDWLQKRTY